MLTMVLSCHILLSRTWTILFKKRGEVLLSLKEAMLFHCAKGNFMTSLHKGHTDISAESVPSLLNRAGTFTYTVHTSNSKVVHFHQAQLTSLGTLMAGYNVLL